MSYGRKSYKFYNRAGVKQEYYWLDLLYPDDDYDRWGELYDDDDYDYRYYSYHDDLPGAVKSMDQYCQMKVLTLLRSLNIISAREEAGEYGW